MCPRSGQIFYYIEDSLIIYVSLVFNIFYTILYFYLSRYVISLSYILLYSLLKYSFDGITIPFFKLSIFALVIVFKLTWITCFNIIYFLYPLVHSVAPSTPLCVLKYEKARFWDSHSTFDQIHFDSSFFGNNGYRIFALFSYNWWSIFQPNCKENYLRVIQQPLLQNLVSWRTQLSITVKSF